MGKFIKGDIVVVPFPFSDLSSKKKRPAFVVTSLRGDDIILCQITSVKRKNDNSIDITDKDFESGSLNQDSNVRPDHLFTADSNIVDYPAGKLFKLKTDEIILKIIQIIKS